MVSENISQYGPMAGAYAFGATSAWGFIMKILLPKELKIVQTEVAYLKGKIAEMEPELAEYRDLKKSALERELREKQKKENGD